MIQIEGVESEVTIDWVPRIAEAVTVIEAVAMDFVDPLPRALKKLKL